MRGGGGGGGGGVVIEIRLDTFYKLRYVSCSPDPTTTFKTMIFDQRKPFKSLVYLFCNCFFRQKRYELWLVEKFVKIQDSHFRNWLLDLISKTMNTKLLTRNNYWEFWNSEFWNSIPVLEVIGFFRPMAQSFLWLL